MPPPPCPAAWPISRETVPRRSWNPSNLLWPPERCPNPQGLGRVAGTESSEAHVSPFPEVLHGLVPLTPCGTLLCLQVTPSSGAWVAHVTNHSKGSMSSCVPVPRACVTLCPSTPGAHVTSCPSPWGPCHLPLSPRGLCHLVPVPGPMSLCAPTFIAPDTDLLVGSPHTHPHSPSTGWWLATSPLQEQKGQPIQGINPCTSLSDPSVQAGLFGCWGGSDLGPQPWLDAGVPRPCGWPHKAPVPGGPGPVPCLLQRYLAQSWFIKDFGTLHPCV